MLRLIFLLIVLTCATASSRAQQFIAVDETDFCFNRGASGLHQDPVTQRIWGWAVYSSQVEPELQEIVAVGRDLRCASRGDEGTFIPGRSTRSESVLCLGDTVYLGVENALLRSVTPGTWDTVDISFNNREFDITSLSYLPNGLVLAGLRTYYVVSREYPSGIPYTVLDSIEQRFIYIADGQVVSITAAPRNETPSKLPLLMPDGTTYSGFYVMKGTSAFMYEIMPDRTVNVVNMPAPSATLLQSPVLARLGADDVLVWFDPSTNSNGYRVDGGVFRYHRPTGTSELLNGTTSGAYCSWSGDGIAMFGALDEICVYRSSKVERYRLSQQLNRDPMLCNVYNIVQLTPTRWLCNTSGGMVFFVFDAVSVAEEQPTTPQRTISISDRVVDLQQQGYSDDYSWYATDLLGKQVAMSSEHQIRLPAQAGLYLLTNGRDRLVVLAE